MPANTTPWFVGTANAPPGETSGTLCTSRTSPNDLVTLFSGAPSVVERIDFQATGTTTTGLIWIWEYDGSLYHIVGEVQVTVVAPSTTTGNTIGWKGSWEPPIKPYVLRPGDILYASTTKAEVFKFAVIAGDF